MVTSSAVVGSSAISSFGLQAIAMAIITRWLMPPESWCGNAVSRRSGSGMPTWFEQFNRAHSPLRLVHAHVGLQRLANLVADGEAGVEACHRLLKDHRHVLAGDLAPRLDVEPHQIVPVEFHLLGRDCRRLRQQPHQRQHGNRFARATLANNRLPLRPGQSTGPRHRLL